MKRIISLLVLVISISLSSCVQEEHEKTVTFSVDMNGIDNVGNVGIRGNFTQNPWRETVPMSDDDNDGVYTLTVSRTTAAYGISFKFVNQNLDYELKDQDNRELVFEYKPERIKYTAKFNNKENVEVVRE